MQRYSAIIFSLFFIMLINTSHTYAAGNLYVVQQGDSLPAIAKKYGTSVQNLKITNGLQSNLLLTGQKLWVPKMYQVVAGDTLQKISSAYHSSVQTIKTTNGLSSNTLYTGQKLKVLPEKMTMRGQYVLMTKEEFRYWLFNSQFNRKIRSIQEHHTWLPSYKNFNGSNHFTLLKGMESFHVRRRKWKNIAQNITTFPDGKLAVSRPFNMDPEGSIGPRGNAGAIMIENVGNFDKGHDSMTKEQRDTIVYITALLSLKFGLTPSVDTITYHHWWDMKTGQRVLDNNARRMVKTCPGTGFFGGNTTASAKKYFYPLVARKMQEISRTMR